MPNENFDTNRPNLNVESPSVMDQSSELVTNRWNIYSRFPGSILHMIEPEHTQMKQVPLNFSKIFSLCVK